MDGYLEFISLLGIPGNLVTWNGAELKSCPANGLNGALVKLPNCPGDNTRSILRMYWVCPANGLNGTLVKLPNCPGNNTRSILRMH